MFLNIAQIIAAAVLIVLILIQERGSGLSGIFGGMNMGHYQTRRGLEKTIFWATIITAAIFVSLNLANLNY